MDSFSNSIDNANSVTLERSSSRTGRIRLSLCLACLWAHASCASLAPGALPPPTSRARTALHSPHVALHRTSCLPPRLPLRLAEVRPLRRCIKLRADIKLHVEHPLWATSIWAHVAAVCFMCFRCTMHMFHLDIAKSRSGVVYVAMTIDVCCKCMFQCFKRMLQVFYLNVAYVVLTIHVCCKCMFQLFQTHITSVLSGCCHYVT
jgi:hypothetical protein